MVNLPELAFYEQDYEERHFVLCWKYLGIICGFELENIFFFFNCLSIFTFDQ